MLRHLLQLCFALLDLDVAHDARRAMLLLAETIRITQFGENKMANEQQSPINIQNAIYAEFGADGLSIHWQGDIHGHVHQDDHGIKVEFASDMRQVIELGGKLFHLRQFHFHHPSEHWIDGEQRTLELHLVHQNIDDGSLAVIGVFLEPGNTKSLTPSLFAQIDTALANEADLGAEANVSTDPRDFLPKTWERHYRYQGSLTTAPFSESVSWIVVKDPITIPTAKLNELLKLFKSHARFPQPLNRRFVLKTFDGPKPNKKK